VTAEDQGFLMPCGPSADQDRELGKYYRAARTAAAAHRRGLGRSRLL